HQHMRHQHLPYTYPPTTKRGQTTTPPMNTRKGPVQHEQGPPHKNYCGSHLLSHNHQVAVPSARMGLATGIGTVNRAFPHHYHHRKTYRPPHPHPNKKRGDSRAVAVQEPHSEREHHKQCNHPTQKGCSCHQRAHHTLTHTPTQKGQ